MRRAWWQGGREAKTIHFLLPSVLSAAVHRLGCRAGHPGGIPTRRGLIAGPQKGEGGRGSKLYAQALSIAL